MAQQAADANILQPWRHILVPVPCANTMKELHSERRVQRACCPGTSWRISRSLSHTTNRSTCMLLA
eukprot:6015398-Amphidinium_carterae.2